METLLLTEIIKSCVIWSYIISYGICADCTPPSCHDSYTNSRPGSPCTCVLPMNVGLRLSIPLIIFFPLVFEFSQEIASGTSIDQSQVRIMGANAANEHPDKTDVLIDLLPFEDHFENSTVFSISEKFWHKELFINSSLFGDYLVLYVTYPGWLFFPITLLESFCCVKEYFLFSLWFLELIRKYYVLCPTVWLNNDPKMLDTNYWKLLEVGCNFFSDLFLQEIIFQRCIVLVFLFVFFYSWMEIL